MGYIVIPTKNKNETDFFMDLLKKMHKEARALSPSKMQDKAFIAALNGSEASGKVSHKKTKNHSNKGTSGKKTIATKTAFNFSWEGGLKELNKDFDGVKLQHHINTLRK
jgi:hypothetical protein